MAVCLSFSYSAHARSFSWVTFDPASPRFYAALMRLSAPSISGPSLPSLNQSYRISEAFPDVTHHYVIGAIEKQLPPDITSQLCRALNERSTCSPQIKSLTHMISKASQNGIAELGANAESHAYQLAQGFYLGNVGFHELNEGANEIGQFSRYDEKIRATADQLQRINAWAHSRQTIALAVQMARKFPPPDRP